MCAGGRSRQCWGHGIEAWAGTEEENQVRFGPKKTRTSKSFEESWL